MPRHVPSGGYPNIQKRIHPLSVSYRVRMRLNGKRINLTFFTEDEAKDWLKENYEFLLENPDRFKKPKKSW